MQAIWGRRLFQGTMLLGKKGAVEWGGVSSDAFCTLGAVEVYGCSVRVF